MQQVNELNKGQNPNHNSPTKRNPKKKIESQNVAPKPTNTITQSNLFTLNVGKFSLQISEPLYRNEEFIGIFNSIVKIRDLETSESEENFRAVYNKDISQLNNTNIQLANKLKFSTASYSHLEEANNNLKTIQYELAGQNKSLRDDNTKLQNRVSKAEAEAKALKSKLGSLTSKKNQGHELISQSQNEKENMAKRLEDLEKQLLLSTQQNQKLHQQIHQLQTEKNDSEKKYIEQQNQMDSLKTKTCAAQRKLEEKIYILTEENARLQKDIDSYMANSLNLYKNTEEQINKIKTEKNKIIDQLKKEIIETDDLKNLKEENALLNKKLDKKQKLIAKLNNEILDLKEEFSLLSHNQTTNQSQQASTEVATEKAEFFRQRFLALTEKYHYLAIDHQTLLIEYQSLLSKFDLMSEKIKVSTSESIDSSVTKADLSTSSQIKRKRAHADKNDDDDTEGELEGKKTVLVWVDRLADELESSKKLPIWVASNDKPTKKLPRNSFFNYSDDERESSNKPNPTNK